MRSKFILFRRTSIKFLLFLILSSALFPAFAKEVIQINQDVYLPAKESQKNVIAIRGKVKVDGTVQQNVVALLGHIIVGSSGTIKGNAVSIGGKIIKEPGAQIKGQEIAIEPGLKFLEKNLFLLVPVFGGLAAGIIGTAILIGSLGFILFLGVLLFLFQKQIEKASLAIWKLPLKVFLNGLIGLFITIPIIVFFALTIIGIPLSLLALGLLAGAIIFGAISVAHGVGTEIAIHLHWELTSFWKGFLGIAILLILCAIPVVGSLVKLAIIVFGLGGIIQTRFQS